MKRPWFSFWAADWLSDGDVMSMSAMERGIYIQLLAVQWKEGSLPNHRGTLYRLAGLLVDEMHAADDEYTWSALDSVLTNFDPVPGNESRLINPRLERERQDAEARSQEAAIKAGKRWDVTKQTKTDAAASSQHVPDACLSQSQSHTQSEIQKKHTSAAAPLELVPVASDPVFDFASVYNAYPRKEGKTKGIARLRSQVRTPEAFESLRAAVANFAEKHRSENTDPKFIPHFSSWASGVWRDYIDGPHIVANKTVDRPGYKAPRAHFEETTDEDLTK